MCSRKCQDRVDFSLVFDDSWEKEIKRLKHDVREKECRILKTELNRIRRKAAFEKQVDAQDTDSLFPSARQLDVYSSLQSQEIQPIERLKLSSAEPSDHYGAKWVLPNGHLDPGPQALESSFEIDCGSSGISLDFGLTSPKRSWCSPPQRIGRAQNREWCSPHRVIDKPDPESSPARWVAIHTQSSPPVSPLHHHASQNPRSESQTTYTVPESKSVVPGPPDPSQPIRKVSVLEDYEPEKNIPLVKKRVGGCLEGISQPIKDKVRRVVDSDGHVIKTSHLNDYEAPVFKKLHEGDQAKLSQKSVKDVKKKKLSSQLKEGRSSGKKKTSRVQTEIKKDWSKETPAKVGSGNQVGNGKEEAREEKEKKEEEEGKGEEMKQNTHQVIKDLEKILRGPDGDDTVREENNGPKQEQKLKTKLKPSPKVDPKMEEPKPELWEKRKRCVDPIAVQEYIKSQKQKRLEQVKTEKKTKDAEREAKKKKLEELRIKTLKLAARSKKKVLVPVIKEVELYAGTEDDITVSLGLKQIKPKVSYNKSILNLKKRAQAKTVESIEANEKKVEEEMKKKEKEETQSQVESKPDDLKKPEETVELKKKNDLNSTLKKLAETLHLKIEEREKHFKSKSVSQVASQESVKISKTEDNKHLVTVDLETIHTLKEDIRKISENFKVLHNIIVDKADLCQLKSPTPLSRQPSAPPTPVKQPKPAISLQPVVCSEESVIPEWLKSVVPKPHPYNVLTAFRHKMDLRTSSVISQSSSTYAEQVSHKYDSDFEALSVPSDRLLSVKKTIPSCTSEENYFTMKEDSGSELSSSILDSDKKVERPLFRQSPPPPSIKTNSSKTSSILSEATSKSTQLASSKIFESISTKSSKNTLSNQGNMILVTPDVKLISNDLHQEKLNNCQKNVNMAVEEMNISKGDQKSESTITEMIDNLSENDKSVKILKSSKERNAVQRVDEIYVRRSFFHPEILHLQFQAELTLLETFQRSLSQFLETERMKTLSEINKIVCDKINVREDQAVQTTFLNHSSKSSTSETETVKTEINISGEDSIKTDKLETEDEEEEIENKSVSEKLNISSKEIVQTEEVKEQKEMETLDLSNGQTGISFQMLSRMMKDEELRSEHQLALIRLREKTLNEKIKAELTFLEMKKRALKDRGNEEEQNVSAIKKKQRGILLKYQSEKEEIERLKKMHRIASDERRIMIKQQKQLEQMQLSTKDMIFKLRRREKSPQKRRPLKPKALKSYDSQSSIQEDIPDSILTTDTSEHSNASELDLTSESEVSRRSTIHLSTSLDNLRPKKTLLEVEKYPRKRHSVEELLSWTKRLEEKENRLKELEKQTNRSKTVKPLKSLKTPMKDRSTSPFQFQESVKTISEVSPSEETKKSSTISEAIEANTSKEDTTEKTECLPENKSNVSEIPEQFSQKLPVVSTSRTMEYNSESFESPSSSETPKNRFLKSVSAADGSHKSVAIKMSLSPRMQSPRRRYSSGSDDSLNLSHTETASEQSDLETRIAALHEQLRKRKLEAERLRREQKKAQRERLRVKEQSLLKQIQAYDAYIQKKKQELEKEYEHSTQTFKRPLIKQPKVAEKSSLKRQEPPFLLHTPTKGPKCPKEESTLSEKIESESEIRESIEKSESVKEELEEVAAEDVETVEETKVEEVESPTKEEIKSTSVSESIVEQEEEEEEESQSESEEQSVSIKTTLHSPERVETEMVETSDSKDKDKQTIDEDVYQSDLFESDFEEEKKSSEVTEVLSEFATTQPDEVEKVEVEEEEEEEEEEETKEESKVEKEEETPKEAEKESLIDEIEEGIIETELSTDGSRQKNEDKALNITESILLELIEESVKVFYSKKLEEQKRSKLSLEALSTVLAKEIISEAVDDILTVYKRKSASEVESERSAERVTSEVRRRICEIMSQAGGIKDQKRPQDMMITTYDVSPVESLPEERELEAAKREEFIQSLSQFKREDGEEIENKIFPEGRREAEVEEGRSECFGQEWFDDDFGLSRTRREAEQLRLQELQIEQEIQQLQAQQEQLPYFYLREIPNKPPPPYTPPGKPLVEVPTSEADIVSITSTAVRILTEGMIQGKDIAHVEPSPEYYGMVTSDYVKCYKFFLFDLAKRIITFVIEEQKQEDEFLPWMRTRVDLSKYKYKTVDRSLEDLDNFVHKQVLVLFGFGKKVNKESLIVRWIKKKRDHVDEILVSEAQEEESQWTRYDEDQVTVKNEVTLAILDSLLEDTAQIINQIFSKKMNRLQ